MAALDEGQVVRLLVEVLDGYSRLGIYSISGTDAVERGLRKAGMRPALLNEALATLAAQGRA